MNAPIVTRGTVGVALGLTEERVKGERSLHKPGGGRSRPGQSGPGHVVNQGGMSGRGGFMQFGNQSQMLQNSGMFSRNGQTDPLNPVLPAATESTKYRHIYIFFFLIARWQWW